jgi:predicted Rossmann fold flavoprotein
MYAKPWVAKPTANHPSYFMVNMDADIVIVGAGAAGLMAAIWAGRAKPKRTIIILDGASTPGAKILVSGGGRCNVTHDQVSAASYAGSSPHAIKKVLRSFDVAQTIAFFQEIGIDLKHEETGKLFPISDRSHDVLDVLQQAARAAGAALHHPRRVDKVVKTQGDSFLLSGEWGQIEAGRLILATGGRSLPRSGTDGHGYQLAQTLGHSITHTFPALVPLTLPPSHFARALSGLSAVVTLSLRSSNGKQLQTFTGSMLCTHFGLSGPVVLDMSRHFIARQHEDPGTILLVNWLPEIAVESLSSDLLALGQKSVGRYLSGWLPGRLVTALCVEAGLAPALPGNTLTRDARKNLLRAVTALPLPITGNRGFEHAEVTAGGVPLNELHLETMESRICPRLHLCGEICDVDGQVGGYNFQWAWASGYVAGNGIR